MTSEFNFKRSFFRSISLISLPCFVYLFELLLDIDLYWFGVKPRTFLGLTGILFVPFKHGDINHLLGNLVSIFPLLFGAFSVLGKKLFRQIFHISIFANALVWVIARPSWHYGLSVLVYGLFFFLMTLAIRFKRRELFIYPLIVLVLFSGFWIGLLPVQPGVSHEGHLAGAISGVIMALFIKNPKNKPISQINSINSTIQYNYNYIYKEKDNI